MHEDVHEHLRRVDGLGEGDDRLLVARSWLNTHHLVPVVGGRRRKRAILAAEDLPGGLDGALVEWRTVIETCRVVEGISIFVSKFL